MLPISVILIEVINLQGRNKMLRVGPFNGFVLYRKG
jgi:hypothetical protein